MPCAGNTIAVGCVSRCFVVKTTTWTLFAKFQTDEMHGARTGLYLVTEGEVVDATVISFVKISNSPQFTFRKIHLNISEARAKLRFRNFARAALQGNELENNCYLWAKVR